VTEAFDHRTEFQYPCLDGHIGIFFQLHRNFFQPLLGTLLQTIDFLDRTTHQPRDAACRQRLIRRKYNLKVQSFISRKLLRSRIDGRDESCATLFLLKEQQAVLRRWRRIRDRKTSTFAKQCIERDGLGGWRRAFQPRDTGKSRNRLGDISDRRILRQPAAQCSGEPIGV
jgi:hypothetical protein